MLTRRRNAFLYEVRKLKREGALYWSDFNGAITIKKEEGARSRRSPVSPTRRTTA